MIQQLEGRKWLPKDTDPMDPKTPPRQRKEEGEPNTPSTETTKQLPLPRRRQQAKLEWKYYVERRRNVTATMLTLIQKVVKKKITMEIDRQILKGEFLFY